MSKSASEVLAELRDRAIANITDAEAILNGLDKIQHEKLRDWMSTVWAFKCFLRWIDELSASDEQTQPGLLPCPFCGGEATESTDPKYRTFQVCCLSPSCDTAPETRTVPIADADEARERWNTRANKTQ